MAIDYCLVIPARLESTRLPRKPLVDIGGKPMIQRTYERALQAVAADRVFIATDSVELAQVCRQFGAQTVLTSSECLTGTDRVAEVATRIPADVYINLQGDEPLMDPSNIARVLAFGTSHPTTIVNGWAWITREQEFRSLHIPKVVLREDGRLLYMSRAPIPSSKSNSFGFARKQVCVYSFPHGALSAFAARRMKSPHEAKEDIEILRFLEMGWDIQMLELTGDSISVDTPADLDRVRNYIRETGA